MKTKLWLPAMVLGVFGGFVLGGSIQDVKAQRGAGARITSVPAGSNLEFISDSKSDGCWLAVLSSEGTRRIVSIAAAPAAACR